MAIYLFSCKSCKKQIELQFGMNDDDKRNNASCPRCSKKLTRTFTSPAAIIKSSIGSTFSMSDAKTFVDHDGQPIRMKFMDHGDRSEVAGNSITKRISGARMDPKTGQTVVDVISNVRDPLGQMERSKQKAIAEGRVRMEKKAINQKYKLRNKKH